MRWNRACARSLPTARSVPAGRTDAGVHGINQVVHFDTEVQRELFSWVRGAVNRYLPADIAIQWSAFPGDDFHARNSAQGRRYAYLLLESAVRLALESGACGWYFRPPDGEAMRALPAALLLGEHDFAVVPLVRKGGRLAGEDDGARSTSAGAVPIGVSSSMPGVPANSYGAQISAGRLLAVGSGTRSLAWLAEVLAARDRKLAAPTLPPTACIGPYYDARHQIPERTAAMDWLP